MPTLPDLAAVTDGPASLTCDALVLGAFADGESFTLEGSAAAVDTALDAGLSGYLTSSGFKGTVGELAAIPGSDGVAAKAVAVVGLGDRSRVDAGVIRRAAGTAARRLSERETLGIALHHAVPGADGAAAEGLLLGSYRFTAYKSDPKRAKLSRILFIDADEAHLERAAIICDATNLARDLTNEPASSLTPSVLAQRARAAAEEAGIGCTVWDVDELTKRAFGGLLGVAAGSDEPPRFIQLTYAPAGATGKIALVGKGVTFDSGGLSLKDASSMETMKTDMGGAAAVIGAIYAVARLKLPIQVTAFVPATENMPSGHAIRPGDVLTHYGGKTTEVLNTDAEGRLILADALAFAREQGPDAIVDVATLTGSIMVALGKKATGLFATNDILADELETAANEAGERVWHMPLYDVYKKELESDIADQKNVGSRWGGAIIAALFLKEFVGDDIPWAHLDIAGAARAESDHDENVKGGTGAAVRTLVRWIEGRAG
jgi:leucyl aminopeptidase